MSSVLVLQSSEAEAPAEVVSFSRAQQALRANGSEIAIGSSQQAYIDGLASADREELRGISWKIASGADAHDIAPSWFALITRMFENKRPIDINALVQHVLRESYVETTRELRFYAEKLKYINAAKIALHGELTRTRTALALAERVDDDEPLASVATMRDPFVLKQVEIRFSGPASVAEPLVDRTDEHGHTCIAISKADLVGYLASIEQQLGAVEEELAVGHIELRGAMQQQQQTLKATSSTARMLNDTALALVVEIGA